MPQIQGVANLEEFECNYYLVINIIRTVRAKDNLVEWILFSNEMTS
jgi:hypothetical protein